MGKYQPFNDLDAETNDALRKSIARFGVVCPVIVDGNGSIIDGHQRARIAGELGLTYPILKRSVKNADDAIALAFSLNTDRRQLSVEQRQAIVADLREQGYSLRAIAGVTNVSLGTVHHDVKQSGVQAEHVTGRDGKQYDAERPPTNVDPETGEISPIGESATSGSDQSGVLSPDAAGPGDDHQAHDEDAPSSAPDASPAPKVALPEPTPDEKYRDALSGALNAALKLTTQFDDHEHNTAVMSLEKGSRDIYLGGLRSLARWIEAGLAAGEASHHLKAVN